MPNIPQPCDQEIFQKGEGVCTLDGDWDEELGTSSQNVEQWVKSVAEKANARVDWHFSGGIASVLHLGDEASRKRVMRAIDELEPLLKGRIFSKGTPAPYRKGVNNPDEARELCAMHGIAYVEQIGEETVLRDPTASALIAITGKHNCTTTRDANVDRIVHFKNRVRELAKTPQEVVIVILNVDDAHGGAMADVLMPNYNWQEIRDKGETPFARGLVDREWATEALSLFDNGASEKLQSMSDQLCIVVVDYGVAEVFEA